MRYIALRRVPDRWRSPGFDLLLATGCLAASLTLAVTSARSQPDATSMDAPAYAASVICCVLVAGRRWYPLGVLAAAAAALALFVVRGYPGGPLILPVSVALYSVGTTVERSRALLVGAGVAVLVAARAFTASGAQGQQSGFALAASGWVMASLVWGTAVRSRRQAVRALRERAEAAERGREQDAARRIAEERLRIARDLHDIVGHAFAAVNVQARLAATVLDADTAQARDALGAIETTSRDALKEIRHTLSVLRAAGPAPDEAGPAGLDRLLEPARAAGLTVDSLVALGGRKIPAPVSAAVHRIVQESVTNTLRHASAHRVTVRVSADNGAVLVEVADDGTGKGTRRAGNGITGMRERAQALGGELTAGPRPGQGFLVTARLPVAG